MRASLGSFTGMIYLVLVDGSFVDIDTTSKLVHSKCYRASADELREFVAALGLALEILEMPDRDKPKGE